MYNWWRRWSGTLRQLHQVEENAKLRKGESPSLPRVDLSDPLAAFRALISPEFASEVSLLGFCITRRQTILSLLLI